MTHLTHKPKPMKLLHITAITAIFTTLLLPVHAVVSTWEGGASGDFDEGTNWSAGVPGLNDVARFLDSGEVIVSFSGDKAIDDLIYQGTQTGGDPPVDPRLTFQMGVHTLDITQTVSFNYSGAGTMTFVQSAGTINFATTMGVAWSSPTASSHSVYVMEGGAQMNVQGSGQTAIGFTTGATGEMHVTDGSTLTANGKLWIGRNGTGILSVRGAGSVLDLPNLTDVTIGDRGGNGTLEILDGGLVTIGNRHTDLGATEESTGTVLVSGAGSTMTANRDLYIGGESGTGANPTVTAAGTGFATFSDGGTATFARIRTLAGDAGLGRIGTLVFDQSGGVTVQNATFDPDSVVRFALYENSQSPDLTVTSTLVLDGSFLEVTIDPLYEPIIGDSFGLIGYHTLVPGAFANEDGIVSINGYSFAIDYSLDGQNVVGLTMIPEPATGAAVAGGLFALFVFFYRRRKSYL